MTFIDSFKEEESECFPNTVHILKTGTYLENTIQIKCQNPH